MEYKKSMIIIILAIFLLSIAGVCASDANDTVVASEDATAIELSQSKEITATDESQKTIQTNGTEILTASDETTTAQNNLDTLSLEEKTYADLSNALGSGGDIDLQPAYFKYNGESRSITITNPGIINGNGAIIDMAGSNIQAFQVYVSGVTFKNMTIQNANFYDAGGAIFFNVGITGTVLNCNFVNNTVSGRGGAIYFNVESTGEVANCNFTGNKAAIGGGAVYFYDNGDVTNCNFINNTAEFCGAISLIKGTVTNCNFTNNYATADNGEGGAIGMNYGSVENCNFINNTASSGGGAILMISGNVTNCNFTNNQATGYYSDGGAIYFSSNGNVTNCIFTNNQATEDYSEGGAVYIDYNGTVTNCTFINNSAQYNGGAVSFHKNGNVTDCTFVNNIADFGGAIEMDLGCVTNCNFTDNTARDEGGAILTSTGSVENCNFVNNTAGNGGAIHFDKAEIENYYLDSVENCNFVNNYAVNDGSAIYFYNLKNGLINGSIFINNTKNIIYVKSGGNITTINSWFGNDATNYNIKPEAGNVTMDNWLFLNATADNNVISIFNSSGIVFKLYLYNESSANMSEYDNTLLMPVNLTITSTNGYVDGPAADLGDSIRYTATRVGYGSVTAKIENVACTIGLNNIKANPDLSAENQMITYGENATIALNYNRNATGKVNITLTGKNGILTYLNLDLNPAFLLLDNVPADEYRVAVAYSGDVNFINATANAALTINRANSTLTINDTIVFDYGTNGSATVSFINASGLVAEVTGQSKAIVNVTNNTLTVSGLNVGNYTLIVTTVPDANHNSVSKNVTVTVNKLKSELSANAVTATYNKNKNLVITLKDANGNALSGASITVKIVNTRTYTTDKNGQIKINVAKLTPKTYTAKITFNGNDIYDKTTKDVKIKVKKAKAKIVAKKKTFKAKKKVKKYKIKLKNNKGKAIKKAKVTLKIKKKTYKAKTNKKGKATFKIKKLKKKGKYKATIKYKGNKYYKKATKKVKIKIK